jgi:hypothetical protein
MNNSVFYNSEAIFVDSVTENCDKIAKIDLILDALLTSAMVAAGNDNIREYSLNDGQTVIRTEYSGTDAVMKSYRSWESIRQIYINRVNGRMVRLVDGKSVNNGRHGGR